VTSISPDPAASAADPGRPEDGRLLSQIRPVGGGDVFEEVLQRLMHLVKLGLVPIGSRLPPERELAASLGVSRQTLREVLRSLVQTGHLETRRGRGGGTFVRDWHAVRSEVDARRVARGMGAQLGNILDLRWVVEPGAAALTARRGTEDTDRRLAEGLAALATAPRTTFPATERRPRDPAGAAAATGVDYRAADAQFHMLIGELTGSRAVFEVVVEIQFQLTDLLSVTPQMAEVLHHSDEQHLAIVDAIGRRDPEGAAAAMREHLESTATFLEAFFD